MKHARITRIVIGDDLRRKANSTQQIFLADPRDIIAVVDTLNQLIDAWNREHPKEVTSKVLRNILGADD